jgi:hypothetical protein
MSGISQAKIRFNRITEKFYQKAPWPEAEAIAPIVNNDPHFLILYRELYYRHIYARLTPSIEHRFASYDVSSLYPPSDFRTIVICLTSFSILESQLVLNYRTTGPGILLTNSFSNSNHFAIIAKERQNDRTMMLKFFERRQQSGAATLCSTFSIV